MSTIKPGRLRRITLIRTAILPRLSIILTILALAKTECNALTHYVVTGGTHEVSADWDYTSWETAGTNIIDVVNVANTNVRPRLVWVTNGTYCMTNRIIATNVTIMSVNGRDVTILQSIGNPSQSGCAYLCQTSVLDGFTINKYYVPLAPQLSPLYVSVSSVRNCLFVGNTNENVGSAIYGSTVVITNCIFRRNRNTSYGTINGGAFTITDSRFENNRSGMYGGACAFSAGNNLVSNCFFGSNSVYVSPTAGGAIWFYTSAGTNNKVLNCSFISNSADIGGAIQGNGHDITIADCSFFKNVATNRGGAISGTNMTIRNCLIALNCASNMGGGLYLTSSSSVENCTIVSNRILNPSMGTGGGFYAGGSTVTGINNIIYFNTAPEAPNFTNVVGNAGLDFSCVYPAIPGTDNITNDPGLINLTNGNYHLSADSPCVNTGTNQSWMTNGVDLDGRKRILYGTVDRGAYERINEGAIYIVH